jgi:hypothetical protein
VRCPPWPTFILIKVAELYDGTGQRSPVANPDPQLPVAIFLFTDRCTL